MIFFYIIIMVIVCLWSFLFLISYSFDYFFFFTVYCINIFLIKLKYIYKSIYRFNVEIVGGLVRNLNLGGGFLGIGGLIIVIGVCCIRGLGWK